MANKRFIDFPIATTVGDNDIILIWQGGANKQTTKATILSGVPDSLNDLTDVTISGLTNGQILRYDSVTGQWENTDQGNLDLNDLNDVTIVSPTNGQVLVYNSSTSKWENSSGGYVPYVGAVTTVDLGLQGLEAGYVRFDTSIVSVPDEQGLMYWDASRSTVALIMNGTLQHIGQDTFFYVKNSTGSSIPKGTCVRFAGTDGASGHLLITPFLANGSVPSTYFLGVTAEEITNGSFGQVMHFGELEGINTSSYTAGDLLYASTTVAGAFQTTAPVAPNNIVLVAAAVNSKNNGAIVVRPTYGSNINNDEGVKITSPTTGDLLQLQAGGLWENKTIDAAGIVTKATNQTITGVKTFSQDIIVNGVNVGRGGGNAVENTSTGNSALSANTTGSGNTANGSFALFKNTSGSGNTAVGTQSLTENTTGSGNTGLGWASLYKNTSGSNNSALGYLSLYENTTGQTNVGIGFYALFKNTTGNDNTALGYTSGAYIADGSTANSISNNSIYIGAYTKALANNQTNQIVIGHNAIGGGSNTVVIGNSSILSNRFFGTMRIGTINNGVGDFITTDANGVLTKRTGAEVRTDIGAGTVTSVAALTLGTSGTDLSSTVANGTTTPVITLNVPTASATNRGALSAADWTTFNSKQNALTNPVTGTGVSGQVAYFTGTTAISSESNLFWDATNDRLGIGNAVPVNVLSIHQNNASSSTTIELTNTSTGNNISKSSRILFVLSDTVGTLKETGFIQSIPSNDPNAVNADLVFGTRAGDNFPNDKMRLFSDGNVLIQSGGTFTNNGARLQVSGAVSTSSKYAWGTAINGTTGQIATDNTHNYFDYLGNLYFRGAAASNNLITFTSAGAATFSSSVTASGTISTTAGFGILSGGGGYAIGPTSTRGIIAINGSGDQILTFSTQSYIYNSASLFRMLSSSDIDFVSGGLQRLFISSSSGNVGIGTPSPNTILDVNGTINVRTNGFEFGRITTNNITGNLGGLTFQYNASGTFTNGIVLNHVGSVGIGTPSPERDSGTRSLAISGAGSLAASLDLYGNARNFAIFTGSAGSLGFFDLTAGAPRMTITSGGNVLIGTTTDNGARLQVSGAVTVSSSFTAGNIFNVSTSTNYTTFTGNAGGNQFSHSLGLAVAWNYTSGGGEVAFGSNKGAGGVGGFKFYDWDGTTSTLLVTILPSGAATFTSTVTATGYITSSDARLKKVISKDGDLAIYSRLDSENIHYGYIAQDMQKDYPNQVHTDDKGFLSLNYVEILVKKVNDLEKKIKQLEQ